MAVNFMETYLTIEMLAALSGSSVRCLRYYDKLGILKPAYINDQTGYATIP
jgi:DNA-binding transcriptional MerR regulator